MIIRPHDPNGENPAARPLQLRRSDIVQPGTSVPGTLPHRDHAPIGRNLTVTKREKATLASHLAFRRRERAALWRAGAPSAEIPNEVRDLPKGKGRPGFHDRPLFYAGDDLLSHTLSRAVQSALRGLTAVFGMGTGGPPRYDHRQNRSRWSLAVGRWLFVPAQTVNGNDKLSKIARSMPHN